MTPGPGARADAKTPGIETLLFLARRMRSALVWSDATGCQSARQDFTALWEAWRAERVTGADAPPLRALDDAFERTGRNKSSLAVRQRYDAVTAPDMTSR